MERRRRNRGFTLVEMMVVIVIIGILAAVVIKQITGHAVKAKVEATKAMISEVDQAIALFKLNHNRYPEELIELLRMPADIDPASWIQGGYLKREPRDAWGEPLIYRHPGTGGQPFDLMSYGDDMREGGEGPAADLWNHDSWKQ